MAAREPLEPYANLIPSDPSPALRAYLANPNPTKSEVVDGLFHGSALPRGARIDKFRVTAYLPPYLRGFYWPPNIDASAVYATCNRREAVGYAHNALEKSPTNGDYEAQLYELRVTANRLADIPRDLRPAQGRERHVAIMRAFMLGADAVRVPLRRARTHMLIRDPDLIEIVGGNSALMKQPRLASR